MTEGVRKGQSVWLALPVLGLLAGLCSIFALVVSLAEGCQEHAQAQWPEAMAHVQTCGVDIYMHQPESYWIDCRISYLVGAEEIVTKVHSRITPAPRGVIWQYPAMQIGSCKSGWMRIPRGRRSRCITIPRTTRRRCWCRLICRWADHGRRAI